MRTPNNFWIVDVYYSDDKFTGTIGNEPGLVSSVSYGDEISVAKNEISDWMYVVGDKIHGNTIRCE